MKKLKEIKIKGMIARLETIRDEIKELNEKLEIIIDKSRLTRMLIAMEEKRIVYEIEDFITILELEKKKVVAKIENKKGKNEEDKV